MSQHLKIVELCKDGDYHCQAQFWPISKSPHKRRKEIEDGCYKGGKWGMYKFVPRKCEHGIKNAFDYKMMVNAGIAQLNTPNLSISIPKDFLKLKQTELL